MKIQVKLLREAILVATLAAAFASPQASAGQDQDEEELFNSKVAYELKDLFKAVWEGTAALNDCGISPYAGEGEAGEAWITGEAVSAAAITDDLCDQYVQSCFDTGFALCELAATMVCSPLPFYVSVVDDKYDNCAGAVYVTGDDVMRLTWNANSTWSLLKEIRRNHRSMDVRVLAVFEDWGNRCGAGASAGKGRPAAGIGNTASVAELDALRMCRQLYGDGECRVSLTGRCNSWN